MLKEYIQKLWSNVYLFLCQQNNISVKWKLNAKSLGQKWQALKDLESSLNNKKVAKKYGLPKKTISAWTKSKTSYFATLAQSSSKREKLRDSDCQRLDQVVLRWF